MAFSKAEIDNLSTLFLSKDDSNTELAFEIMANKEFSSDLITEVFTVYKLSNNLALRTNAAVILQKYGTPAVQEAMRSKIKLDAGANEKKLSKNIKTYCTDNEMNGTKLATAMFRKFGLGANYLLNEVSKAEQIKNIQIFITDKKFQLNHAAITKFPRGLFEYPLLEEIDLSDNKIRVIPDRIKIFKNLKVLRLPQNYLNKISEEILYLKKLTELHIDPNFVRGATGIIKDFEWMKKWFFNK